MEIDYVATNRVALLRRLKGVSDVDQPVNRYVSES